MCADTIEDVPFQEQNHQRAARYCIDNIPVELSCPAAAHSACRGHLCRMYRRAEAVAVRAECIEGHRGYDRRYFS